MARRIRIIRSGGTRRVIRHRTRSVKPSRTRNRRKGEGGFFIGWLFGNNRIWKHSGKKGWWGN